MQPASSPPNPSRSAWLWAAAVLLAACLAFAGTLAYPFVHDDLTVIGLNPLVQEPGRALEAFRSEYWGMRLDDPGRDRLYRPLTVLTLALNQAWGGNDPGGYRALNILLHALASLLLLLAARRMGMEQTPAGAVALLFALHPLHTEAVNAVVARADLMAAIGVFAGMALLLGRALPAGATGGGEEAPPQGREKEAPGPSAGMGEKVVVGAGAALALLFALLSKEAGAALFLFAGAWWLWGRAAGWKGGPRGLSLAAWAGMGAALLIYLYLRYAALGLWVRPVPPSRLDNPLAHAGLLERIWGALGVLGRYLKLHLWPWPLSLDYSYAQVMPGGAATALFALAGLAAMAAWGWLAWKWREESPSAGLGLALFLAAYLPVANLLMPIGTVMAERAMYLPSAGFLLAVVPAAGRALAGLGRRLPAAALAAAALIFGGLTLARNQDWSDPQRLWERAAQVSPRSARALRSQGQHLIHKNRFAEAIPLLREAVRIYPLYDYAWIDLGIAQMQSRHEREAEASLKEALRLRGDTPEAHLALGALYNGTGRLDEAQGHLERAVALAPRLVEARFNLGTLYLKKGERTRAIEHLQAALALERGRGDAHHNLAIALYLEGDQEEARRHAQEAARLGVRLHPALAKALGLAPDS